LVELKLKNRKAGASQETTKAKLSRPNQARYPLRKKERKAAGKSRLQGRKSCHRLTR